MTQIRTLISALLLFVFGSARLGFCAAVFGLSLIGSHQTLAAPLVTVAEIAPGQFQLSNNSSNWFIYGFEIEQPAFASNPTTTDPWSAYTCTLSCNVGAPAGFGYVLNGNPFTAGIKPNTSSSIFLFDDAGGAGSNVVDGTSNTILFSEALRIFVFAATLVGPITDGTSNTIQLPEIGHSGPIRLSRVNPPRRNNRWDKQYDIFRRELITPVPAALPLFATGLGALGLLAWRRKRKAVAGRGALDHRIARSA